MHTPAHAAVNLQPMLRARSAEISAARRLPADIAQDFAKAGLFRLLVPRAIGGLEATPQELSQVLATLAQADASAAWCVMIGATTGLVSAYLPQDVAREVFADPLAITGGVFAPQGQAVRDGDDFIVNGRWAWASGSQNCAWLGGGCLILHEGAPRMMPNGLPENRMMIMRRSDVELIDTWNVMGLEGTGSVDMTAANVRVPAARSVSLMSDKPAVESPLYAFPAFGLLSLGIASVAWGNAKAAIQELTTLATAKRPTGARRVLADRSHTQSEVARAHAQLRGAGCYLEDAVGKCWDAACGTGELPLAERAELRLASTHMVKTAADVARAMQELAGGTAVYLTSPIQRRFRDAHVMTQHMMVAHPTLELAGRALLGLNVEDPSF
jgi:indole-3-acetate monooxygenase